MARSASFLILAEIILLCSPLTRTHFAARKGRLYSWTPHTVLICVETTTAITGPMIQMISCADASSENNAETWLPGTILG